MTDHKISPSLDYAAIEQHIRRARTEQSAVLGEFIADGVIATWTAVKRAAGWIARQAHAISEPPREYTTSLPRQF